MMTSKTRIRWSFAVLAAAVLLASPASAQSDWPTRPIRIIVPYAAGGPTDLTIRTLAPVVSAELGQPVVVENKLGGATMTATQAVVSADPDGYTIGAAAAPLALNTALGVATPYDPIKDLQHVIKLVDVPACVLVNPKHPAKTFGELVSWAKAQQDPVLFATAGAGSMPHLWFSYVANKLGFRVKHVGYRGSAPALLDLIAGSVNLMVDAYNPSCQRQATGEVRVLGYGWDKRLAVQPDVPTLKEQGFDVQPAAATFGIIAPKATPDEIVARLNAAFNKALNDPATRAVLEKNSLLPSGSTPAEYKAFVANQIEQWTGVAKDNHIEAEK